MQEHHLPVQRTARFHTLGPWNGAVGQLWFVLHGHSQLAAPFLQEFAALDDGTRLVIAPEALSRFYLETSVRGGHGPRIGATWMTREDRHADIGDNIHYLERLAAHAVSELATRPADVRVLGFSQGGSTAARWVAAGGIRPRELVLWGSLLPEDVMLDAANPVWREVTISFVRGSEDKLIPPALLEAQFAKVQAAGIASRVLTFEGGHRIDAETLLSLAQSPVSPR